MEFKDYLQKVADWVKDSGAAKPAETSIKSPAQTAMEIHESVGRITGTGYNPVRLQQPTGVLTREEVEENARNGISPEAMAYGTNLGYLQGQANNASSLYDFLRSQTGLRAATKRGAFDPSMGQATDPIGMYSLNAPGYMTSVPTQEQLTSAYSGKRQAASDLDYYQNYGRWLSDLETMGGGDPDALVRRAQKEYDLAVMLGDTERAKEIKSDIDFYSDMAAQSRQAATQAGWWEDFVAENGKGRGAYQTAKDLYDKVQEEWGAHSNDYSARYGIAQEANPESQVYQDAFDAISGGDPEAISEELFDLAAKRENLGADNAEVKQLRVLAGKVEDEAYGDGLSDETAAELRQWMEQAQAGLAEAGQQAAPDYLDGIYDEEQYKDLVMRREQARYILSKASALDFRYADIESDPNFSTQSAEGLAKFEAYKQHGVVDEQDLQEEQDVLHRAEDEADRYGYTGEDRDKYIQAQHDIWYVSYLSRRAQGEGTLNARYDRGYVEPKGDWTPEEKAYFGYLYAEDPKQAEDYAGLINRRNLEAQVEGNDLDRQEHATRNFWTAAGDTIKSIGEKVLAGIPDYGMMALETDLRGGVYERDLMGWTREANVIRGAIAADLDSRYGTISDDIPVIGGQGLGELYQLLVGIGDSAASIGLGGEVGSLISFFGGAAADTTRECLDMGMDPDKAVWTGFASGMAEVLTEKFSVENFLENKGLAEYFVHGVFRTMAKQGLIEMSEEMASDLLNYMYERIANGETEIDRDYWTTMVNAQYAGIEMDPAEARKIAEKKWWENVCSDGIGGLISGGIMSGGNYISVTVPAAVTKAKPGDAKAIAQAASTLDPESEAGKAWARYQQQYQNGNLSNYAAQRMAILMGGQYGDITLDSAARIAEGYGQLVFENQELTRMAGVTQQQTQTAETRKNAEDVAAATGQETGTPVEETGAPKAAEETAPVETPQDYVAAHEGQAKGQAEEEAAPAPEGQEQWIDVSGMTDAEKRQRAIDALAYTGMTEEERAAAVDQRYEKYGVYTDEELAAQGLAAEKPAQQRAEAQQPEGSTGAPKVQTGQDYAAAVMAQEQETAPAQPGETRMTGIDRAEAHGPDTERDIQEIRAAEDAQYGRTESEWTKETVDMARVRQEAAYLMEENPGMTRAEAIEAVIDRFVQTGTYSRSEAPSLKAGDPETVILVPQTPSAKTGAEFDAQAFWRTVKKKIFDIKSDIRLTAGQVLDQIRQAQQDARADFDVFGVYDVLTQPAPQERRTAGEQRAEAQQPAGPDSIDTTEDYQAVIERMEAGAGAAAQEQTEAAQPAERAEAGTEAEGLSGPEPVTQTGETAGEEPAPAPEKPETKEEKVEAVVDAAQEIEDVARGDAGEQATGQGTRFEDREEPASERDPIDDEMERQEALQTAQQLVAWLKGEAEALPEHLRGLTRQQVEDWVVRLATRIGMTAPKGQTLQGDALVQRALTRVEGFVKALGDMANRDISPTKGEGVESGVVINGDDGEKLSGQVTDVKYQDGHITVQVQTDAGTRTVQADELGGKTAVVLDTLEQLLGPAHAVEAYGRMDAGQQAESYGIYFGNVRLAAQAGIDMETAIRDYAGQNLTRDQAELAYTLGSQMRKADGGKLIRTGRGTGKVSFGGGTINVTTADGTTQAVTFGGVQNIGALRQRADFRAAVGMAKALGIDLVFYESTADQRGRYTGAQGIYHDGKIWLDVNAGAKTTADVGKRMLMTTMSHELTHFLAENAPEEYMALRQTVVKYLMKEQGLNFADVVRSKLARTSQRLDYDAAVEEVIADACETMLVNSTAVEQMAANEPGLFMSIRYYISRFIHRVLAGHPESKVVQKYLREIQELWDRALIKAVQNRTQGETLPTAQELAQVAQEAQELGTRTETETRTETAAETETVAEAAEAIQDRVVSDEGETETRIRPEPKDVVQRQRIAEAETRRIAELYSQTRTVRRAGPEKVLALPAKGQSTASLQEQAQQQKQQKPKKQKLTPEQKKENEAIRRRFRAAVERLLDVYAMDGRDITQEQAEQMVTDYAVTHEGYFDEIDEAKQRGTFMTTNQYAQSLKAERFRQRTAQEIQQEIDEISEEAMEISDRLDGLQKEDGGYYDPMTGKHLTIAQQVNLQGRYQQLENRYMELLEEQAGETNENAAQTSGGAKMSERDGDSPFSNNPYLYFNRRIEMADVRQLRQINGGKRLSVNQFTPLELRKTQKWAYKYYHMLGVKSPFFRAWFGEWRSKDQTPVKIVDVPKMTEGEIETYYKSLSGNDIEIYDTKQGDAPGWKIAVESGGYNNTKHHAGGGKKSFAGLSAIRGLVNNGVLLDTEIHEFHPTTKKRDPNNDPGAFNHRFYTLGMEDNGQINLYRVNVLDQYQGKNKQNDFLFHNLKQIEVVATDIAKHMEATEKNKVAVSTEGHATTPSESRAATLAGINTTTTFTVADLYRLVKMLDKDFNVNPHDNVSEEFLNPDGTPKAVFRDPDVFFSTDNPAAVENNAQTKSADNIGTFDRTNPDPKLSMRDDSRTDREMLMETDGAELSGAEKTALDGYRAKVKAFEDLERQVQAQQEVYDKLVRSGKATSDELGKARVKLSNLEQRMQNALKAVTQAEADDKTILEIIRKERDIAQRRVSMRLRENYSRKELRARITKLYDDLNRRITKPSEKKQIPVPVMMQAIEVLEAINMDSTRPGSTAGGKLRDKLAALAQAYNAIQKDPDYNDKQKATYDPVVADMLDRMVREVGNTPINRMSVAQMQLVYDTLTALDKTARDALKVRIRGEERLAYQVAGDMAKETRSITKDHTSRLDAFFNAQLSPERMFRRLGGYHKDSTWMAMYDVLNQGQLKQTQIQMEASQIFDNLLSGKNYDRFVDPGHTVDVGLKDAGGNAVKITHGMMVALWMHLQNEQNVKHVMDGGLTVPNLKAYYNGQQRNGIQAVGISQGIGALREELAQADESERDAIQKQIDELQASGADYIETLKKNIERQLTDYDRQWIAAAKELFDTYSKGRLNETTMEVYGIKKANVDNYFPLSVDQDYLNTPFETIIRDMSLENAGFMKERVDSGRPIHLFDVSDVAMSQIRKVSQYCGLMPAVRTFNKVWGKTEIGYQDSLKRAVKDKFEKQGAQYIEHLMADLNGARRSEETTFGEVLNKLRGNMARASLTLSLRTAMGQAASYPTAASVIGWKPLARALATHTNSDRRMELIQKWSPLMWYRSKGYSTTELGDIAGNNSKFNRLWKKMYWATGWIQWADMKTVGKLWDAAEIYVTQNGKGLKKGSDAYYQEVAKVFNDIVERTQPNYTTMQRPDILRNPNALVKQLTMFMTQRLQNFNILYDSIATYSQYRADLKAGRNGVTKADVDTASRNVRRAVSSQMVAAATIAVFKAFADALLHSLRNYRDDDEELTKESVSIELLDMYLDSLAGNILGGGEVYDLIEKYAFGKTYYGIDVGSVTNVSDMISSATKFMEKTVAGIRDGKPAGEILLTKDANTFAKDVMNVFGIPLGNAEKIVMGMIYHAQDAINGEPLSFEAGVSRTTAQQAHRLYRAYLASNYGTAKRIREEVGDDAKLNTALATYIKQQYAEGNISQSTAQTQLVKYAGRTASEAEETMRQYSAEVETGIKYAGIQEAFVSGDIDKAETVKMLMKYGNMDKADAEEKVLQYQCQKDTGIKYTQIGRELELGSITEAKASSLWQKYGGMESGDADTKASWTIYKSKHPDTAIESAMYKTWYQKIRDSGVDPEVYAGIRSGVDADGNGSINMQEASAALETAINSGKISEDQAEVVWKSFNKSWKKTYKTYHG